MSITLGFEPHNWYMGFAIKKRDDDGFKPQHALWYAVTDNGMTGYIDELEAYTLSNLKQEIRNYHVEQHNGYGERLAKHRLNYLRKELRAARMSYGEIAELESLTSYIDADDVELLEAAGVPEFEDK